MDMQNLKSQLGSRIKSFREKKGYTQEQFCEIIDLDQSNLSNIENGKTFPDTVTLISIINKAGIEPNFLFGFTEDDNINYQPLDYEIIDLFKDLPNETKVLIKNFLKLIK